MMNFELEGETWGVNVSRETPQQLKADIAEIDVAIFNLQKTKDLRGNASLSLKIMRKRRASLQTKLDSFST